MDPAYPGTLPDLEGHEKVQAWKLEVHHSVDQEEKTSFLNLYRQSSTQQIVTRNPKVNAQNSHTIFH